MDNTLNKNKKDKRPIKTYFFMVDACVAKNSM